MHRIDSPDPRRDKQTVRAGPGRLDCTSGAGQPTAGDKTNHNRESTMSESVYKIIEIVGTSKNSWEDAAKTAVERAAKSLRDLRVAEVSKLDMVIDEGKVSLYRARITVSFKFED